MSMAIAAAAAVEARPERCPTELLRSGSGATFLLDPVRNSGLAWPRADGLSPPAEDSGGGQTMPAQQRLKRFACSLLLPGTCQKGVALRLHAIR